VKEALDAGADFAGTEELLKKSKKAGQILMPSSQRLI
jgi:hypothetical protein